MVGFFVGPGIQNRISMEDFTRDWKKLSLTEKEGEKLDLSKK